MSETVKYLLDESRLPKDWYNIVADLPRAPDPVLHPDTLKPIGAQDLEPEDDGAQDGGPEDHAAADLEEVAARGAAGRASPAEAEIRTYRGESRGERPVQIEIEIAIRCERG